MKTILTIALTIIALGSFAQGPQTWPEAFNQDDVTAIKNEITIPMSTGGFDAVIDRIVFPFEAGDKKYSKAELEEEFDDLFSPELCSELASGEYYEVMNPDGNSYMLVCMNAPAGYEGAVPVFMRVDGVWMLANLGLYED